MCLRVMITQVTLWFIRSFAKLISVYSEKGSSELIMDDVMMFSIVDF